MYPEQLQAGAQRCQAAEAPAQAPDSPQILPAGSGVAGGGQPGWCALLCIYQTYLSGCVCL